MFLCHRFCELGATELTGALRDVREFLVEHPDEVLIIVIEDYVLPSAIVAAFEESGLAEKVYRGPPAGPFPTLREMIDSGRQVVVYAENHGGARAVVHARLRRRAAGDAVHVQARGAAHDAVALAGDLRPEPRDRTTPRCS